VKTIDLKFDNINLKDRLSTMQVYL